MVKCGNTLVFFFFFFFFFVVVFLLDCDYCLPLIMVLTKTSHGVSAHSLQRLRPCTVPVFRDLNVYCVVDFRLLSNTI